MYTFRFLHLSDYHFSAGNSVFRPRFSDAQATAAAAFAKREASRLDGILITGDMAHLGSEQDLRFAYNALTQHAFYNLRRCNRPILLLPGNHDRFTGLWRKPGGQGFERHFHEYWAADQFAKAVKFRARGGESLAFVFCDFSLESLKETGNPAVYLGQGRAYRERLKHLEYWTAKLEPEVDALIWAFHFAPWYPNLDGKLRLQNEDELLLYAERRKVAAILCGHTHEPMAYVHPGSTGIKVYCAGAVAATGWSDIVVKSSGAIHLLEVTVGASRQIDVTWITQTWDARSRTFGNPPIMACDSPSR